MGFVVMWGGDSVGRERAREPRPYVLKGLSKISVRISYGTGITLYQLNFVSHIALLWSA